MRLVKKKSPVLGNGWQNLHSTIAIGLLVLMLGVLAGGCGHQPEAPPGGPIIARMDRVTVTAEEFREFYELDPLLGEWETPGESALRVSLERLLVRKWLYGDSLAKGAFKAGRLKTIFTWEIRQAMLRQLFREEVQRQVTVTEQELRAEYVKLNEEIYVRHLFFPTLQQARDARRRLVRGEATFEQFAREVFQDSLLVKCGGALGWVRASDLYRSLEEQVFELRPGEISAPVKSPWGYHILRVDSIRGNPLLREDDFQSRKKVLARRVRIRKMQALASRYIQELLQPKVIRLKHETFNRLWDAIRSSQSERNLVEDLRTPKLTNAFLNRLGEVLAPDLDRPLIQYKGGAFTLKNFLKDLENVPVSNRCRVTTRFQLINDLGIWVRDQFLLQEAHRKKLMSHPRVRQEVAEVLGNYLYQRCLYQILDTLTTPATIQQYFRAERKEPKNLQAADSLAQFFSLVEWQYHRAQRLLHNRVLKQVRFLEIDGDFLREEAQRVNWRAPVKFFVFRLPS